MDTLSGKREWQLSVPHSLLPRSNLLGHDHILHSVRKCAQEPSCLPLTPLRREEQPTGNLRRRCSLNSYKTGSFVGPEGALGTFRANSTLEQ